MKKNEFELLQPVTYGHVTGGYISFISEEYITICFKDIPLPKVQTHGGVVTMLTLSFTLNFGMKYAVVWMKNKKKGTSIRSDLLQFGRCRSVGTAHKQNATC